MRRRQLPREDMSAEDLLTDERVHFAPQPPQLPGPDNPDGLAGERQRPDTNPDIKGPPARRHVLRRLRHRMNLAGRLRSAFDTEIDYGTPFLVVPALLGIGGLTYFASGHEPGWSPLVLGLAVVAAVSYLARNRQFLFLLLLAAAFLIAGALAGKIETWRAGTKMLGSPVTTTLTGIVAGIERQSGGRARVIIDVIATERPYLRFAPDRVRIVARKPPAGLRPGLLISGRARLIPHSGPARPQGYDFAFHNYFRGFGAVGFFLGEPSVQMHVKAGFSVQPSIWLQRARDWLTLRVKDRVGGREGEIAAALITGAKSGIPEDVNEALRRTGLAHILSISGLHMALVAGTVIAVLRLGFALFPDFASKHPVRKFAAAAALATVFLYLFISGTGIATQRSFLMLAVMLIALLMDRPAITMRNLAIAAVIIILLQPHEVAGPSFQMSFAATAALVAGYAVWTRRQARKAAAGKTVDTSDAGTMRSALRKLLLYAAALAMTSIIAGAATTIYGVWHFNRLAPLGLFANLAAMPVVSLVIMPSAVLAVVLVPFELDGPAFTLMGQGIRLVVFIATWFSERTPVDVVGMIPVASLVAASLGLIMATLPATRLRLISLPVFAAAFVLAVMRPVPDMFIEESGKMVAALRDDGRLATNRKRPRAFVMGMWKHALAATDHVGPVEAADPVAAIASAGAETGTFHCNGTLCLLRLTTGAVVAHAKNAPEALPACGVASLIIVESATGPPEFCSAERPAGEAIYHPRIISARDLAHYGSASVRFNPRDNLEPTDAGELGAGAIKVTHAISKPWRPWHAHRAFSREARGLPPYQRRKKK